MFCTAMDYIILRNLFISRFAEVKEHQLFQNPYTNTKYPTNVGHKNTIYIYIVRVLHWVYGISFSIYYISLSVPTTGSAYGRQHYEVN